MKKALFTMLVVFLLGVFAFAQSTQNPSTTPSNPDTSVQNPDQNQNPNPQNPASNPDVNKTPDQQTAPQATPETLPQSDKPNAQEEKNESSQTEAAEHHGKMHEKNITGCLAKSTEGGNTFSLVTKNGKKTIEVIPDASLQATISEHVGHKVRLSGVWTHENTSSAANTGAESNTTQSASASNPANPSNPNETGNLPQSDQPNANASEQSSSTSANAKMNNKDRVFKADKLEHISATCNAGSNMNTTQPQSNPQ